jgi:hypothetical protein
MAFHLIAALLLVRSVIAVLVNVTIDDQYGDALTGLLPSYSPSGIWEQGANCSTCTARPNPSQASMGTWHDTTYLPTETEPCVVSLMFSGELKSVRITLTID